MKEAGKPHTGSSVVNFVAQADNFGKGASISPLNAAVSGDSRLQTALHAQGILGKRPAPMTEADKSLLHCDINTGDHEHLAKYTSAQEADFLQSKRRRLTSITDLVPA